MIVKTSAIYANCRTLTVIKKSFREGRYIIHAQNVEANLEVITQF